MAGRINHIDKAIAALRSKRDILDLAIAELESQRLGSLSKPRAAKKSKLPRVRNTETNAPDNGE